MPNHTSSQNSVRSHLRFANAASRRGLTAVALCALLGLMTLCLALPALAVDGVAEINQACAVHTGCFPGDVAGYPVTIDGQAGGSYRLTSNLVIPDALTDGILISTSSISIDLNGFEIIGLGCVGAAGDCRPISGSGDGIRAQDPRHLYDRISVRNGSITGMGDNGVSLGEQAEIIGLRTSWNRSFGISVEAGSIVRGNISRGNSQGIAGDVGALITGNVVEGNLGNGINASSGSTVAKNTVRLNGLDGINVGDGVLVTENMVYLNGDEGIDAGPGSTVQRNSVRSNVGFGLVLGTGAAYRENVITNNGDGTVFGVGVVNMFSNSCDGTTSCP